MIPGNKFLVWHSTVLDEDTEVVLKAVNTSDEKSLELVRY